MELFAYCYFSLQIALQAYDVEFCSHFGAVLSDPANSFQLLGRAGNPAAQAGSPTRAAAVLGRGGWQKSRAEQKGVWFI